MVFVKTCALLSVLPFATAWPTVMQLDEQLQKRADPPPRAPLFKSGRANTGTKPSQPFDAKDQFVNVTSGSGHEFAGPVSGDLRGQCPGLNAAANHGFIPRNGIVSIAQTVSGLGAAYNMGQDLALALAIISVATAGDPVAGTWSIGGSFPATLPIFSPGGIVSTHNRYEGDASIVKGDAYLHNGNVGFFEERSWEHLYNLNTEYTLDDIAAQSDYVTRWSILNNPYYFSAPFSGLVAPAAHDFVINFMSNHSAAKPGGTLTREVLKSFFAVTGDNPSNFAHNQGQERIPENWYRRPSSNQYTTPDVFADVLVNNAMYPGIVRFGGNTGTVDSFAGVDLQDLTGGVFNLATLGNGNNAACFFLQASLAGLPSTITPVLGAVGSVLGWATSQLTPINSQLGCPQLATFNNALFNKFPGASYKTAGT